MRPTSRLLYIQKLRPFKAYVFRNTMSRSVEEANSDMNYGGFMKAHMPGDYGWSLEATVRDFVYNGRWRVGASLALCLLAFPVLMMKVVRPDLTAGIDLPFFGNSLFITSGERSPNRYNWDDINIHDPYYTDDHSSAGFTPMPPQRARLRYDRYLYSETRREAELSEVDALVKELKMNM
eukprot:TRINITY_DN37621_c0_g1_i1.p1 TRINITY_DN37621_c0_g1~~TRINITY_DN37621_c0_g1_i1.p1  ORF type:complete len:198 (+),score=37.53 TRINITY_DN37621_c0_g1_i1:59-595(+)